MGVRVKTKSSGVRADEKSFGGKCQCNVIAIRVSTQEANLVEEVEDSPDFWSGSVQSYNSPVEHRFLIGPDWSTNVVTSITGL